jgi:predicted DNA binding CopG/RHH family protein
MLPADLIRRVKSAAALQGITLKQYIAEALEAKLQAEVVSTER